MLVLLAGSWSMNCSGMETGYTGLVLARHLLLPTRNGCDGICMMRIAYYGTRVVNSAGEFELREGAQLQLMQ